MLDIKEAFAALTGSRWFSVMGFYKVELEEEDKLKTAFVTPMSFWEFNRMPESNQCSKQISKGYEEIHELLKSKGSCVFFLMILLCFLIFT